jgi:hypothetical protein
MFSLANSSLVNFQSSFYAVSRLEVPANGNGTIKVEKTAPSKNSIKLSLGLYLPSLNAFTDDKLLYLETPRTLILSNPYPSVAKVFVRCELKIVLRVSIYTWNG